MRLYHITMNYRGITSHFDYADEYTAKAAWHLLLGFGDLVNDASLYSTEKGETVVIATIKN